MKVLHISTECYPAAKAGGMGDVVGSLPIYLPIHGVEASVIIPKYKTKWIEERNFEMVYESSLQLGKDTVEFSILKLKNTDLGFPFYVIDIPNKFDRANIYLDEDGEAFPDEIERNISFQRGVLDWIKNSPDVFDLLHCHDHMTGLMAFMVQYCTVYESLSSMPMFFTIHNGQYRGAFDWKYVKLLPKFDVRKGGLLEWDDMIHSLASAIKCSWMISTVSPSYLKELNSDFDTLTSLMRFENYKSVGILNGIDDQVWDPVIDPLLEYRLKRSVNVFKQSNKKALANQYEFKSNKILVSFIGRFAYEKSADLLVPTFEEWLKGNKSIHFFILGSGDKSIEGDMIKLQKKYPDNITAVIAYNEKLAHQIYSASDFILMPSRFEPCGLNQMYAMRYGTVPITRFTGGLKDTVPDIGDDGNGISFLQANKEDIIYSLKRAVSLYKDSLNLRMLINKIMNLDFSWVASAKEYKDHYIKTVKRQ